MIRNIAKCILLASVVTSCTQISFCQILETREKNAYCDMQEIYKEIDLPNKPLTLEDIIVVAMEHNFEARAKELEAEVQAELATGDLFRMLPSVTISGELSKRSNSTASTGLIVATNTPEPASISTERRVRRWDITMTFRVLDFALAYFRSHQFNLKAAGIFMQYVRLKQNIILDIFKSYWKAMAAFYAMRKSDEILALIAEYRSRLDGDMERKLLSVVPGLRIEDQLLSYQLQFYNFDLIYQSAKAELAALMGLPADVDFELAPMEIDPMPEMEPVEELEEIALHARPELYGADLDEEVAIDDVRQAIVRFLPSEEFFRGYFENSDKFLVHKHWIAGGLRAAWDLLGLPSKAFDIKAAKVGRTRAYIQRLAISVAILSQVHLSLISYQNLARLYQIRRDIANVRNRLASATTDEFIQGDFNFIEVIVAKANALQADIDLINTYGDYQVALEGVNNSIGKPLRYNTIMDEMYQIVEEVPECTEEVTE